MCGLCGLLAGEAHWSESVSGDRPRRQERGRRVASINRVLDFYRLTIDDFEGVSFVLRNRTGKAEIVSDLGALCRAAAAMTTRPFDPLDPALLDMLRVKPA